MDDRKAKYFLRRLSVVYVSGLISATSMNSLAADMVADGAAPQHQQPIITETANGVTQVNIQTPNSAGVSRNQYRQFDVDKDGVILNNSAQHTQTQLGGWVQGNSLLAGGTAKIILNEVNSQNPSLLHGPMEIAGSRAQVVVANPAGISCDGCGFINAHRSTLTTGNPLFNNGNLSGFDVNQGHISISGVGMDDRDTAYSDIIARTVEINADIWANQLSITSGLNQVSRSNQVINSEQKTQTPTLSIDIAELGGMYADTIHLIGTENGIGVRHAGDMHAQTLTLNSRGQLKFEQSSEVDAERFEANVANFNNHSGATLTANDLAISTEGEVLNQGVIDGQLSLIKAASITNRATGAIYADDLLLEAIDIHNQSELSDEGLLKAPTMAARQSLAVAAQNLTNDEAAVIYSAGDMKIAGELGDEQIPTADMARLTNTGGLIEAVGELNLAVMDLQNLNAEVITEWQTDSVERIIEVQPEGWSRKYDVSRFPKIHNHYVEKQPFVNEEGRVIRYFEDYSYYDYYATTESTHLISSKPAKLIAGSDLSIHGNVFNADSQIIAGGNLTVTGGSLNNQTTAGQQRISYQGRRQFRDWEGNDEELDFYPWTPYSPAAKVTEFNLATTQVESQSDTSGQQTLYSSGDIPVLSASWFQQPANASDHFYIETDPRFTDYRDWLGSDYMLQKLAMDPSLTMKRLGDGFVEQRLVNEQIAQLTGQRFLSGFENDEAQFMTLMDAGVSFAEAHELTPGVSLNAEQVAMLTSDIVWLEQEEVQLASGETLTALVPKVYVKARPDDFQPETGLLAGKQVDIQTTDDIINTGSIAGRAVVNLNSDFVQHGGHIQAAEVEVNARNVAIAGGKIQADEGLNLTVEEDINISSVTSETSNREGKSYFSRSNIKRVAGLYLSGGGAELNVTAGRNMNIAAADIQHTGEDGKVTLSAANDLELGTVNTSETNNSILNAKDFNKHSEHRDIGTLIATNGDISLTAGNQLEFSGVNINSQAGEIAIKAEQVEIKNATASYRSDIATHTERDGTFSSKSKDQRDIFNESTAVASVVSGQAIHIESQSDINITGSQLVADKALSFEAANNINVTAAEERYEHEQYVNEEESGLLSSGGIGFTIGSQQLDVTDISRQTRQMSSELGSLEGDVTLSAGQNYVQRASDVMAVQGDIDINAAKVDIESGTEILRREHTTEFSQSGLSVSITNPVISAVQAADQIVEAARETSDPRMKALAAATIGLNANNAYNKVLEGQGTTINGKPNQIPTLDANGKPSSRDANAADNVGGINLAISIGSSESSSQRKETIKQAHSSKLAAGGDITISAVGEGENSDLTVKGSEIQAADSVSLEADGDVKLLAAKNTRILRSENDSSSGSIGFSIGTDGLLFTAGMSKGEGEENGQDRSWTETTVSAGEKVALESGADTVLKGAVVSGDQVTADVGDDLTIQSLQDTSQYQSEQESSGGSISVGYGKMSGGFHSSESEVDSDYASVIEQSGVNAGDFGFQINVEGDTKLRGAIISSSQEAVDNQRNRLDTDTLVVADIANKSEYDAESSDVGVGLSYDPVESVTQNMGENLVQLPAALTPDLNKSGDDQTQTRTAISSAEITINNEERQIALTGKYPDSMVDTLNRDTDNANNPILAKPDVHEIKDELEANSKIISQASKEVTIAINRIYEKRMAEYDALYDEILNSAREKEEQALEQQAQGNETIAFSLEAQAQSLRYHAIDIRNERDAPKLSQGLALALANTLVGSVGGKVNLGESATKYAVGALGEAFLLTAKKRDSDITQGFVARCLRVPTYCVKAANELEDVIKNDDLSVLQRIQELKKLRDKNGNLLFAINAVDSNHEGHFNIVSNGILNEPDRAIVVGIGHLPTNKFNQSLYLSYNDTQGILADLVNAGIDKFAQSTSNTSDALLEAVYDSKGNVDGSGETIILPHSGGTLVANIALNQYAASKQFNPKLYVKYYGPASSVDEALQASLNAAGLSEATAIEKENWINHGEKNGPNGNGLKGFEYFNHPDDTVASLIGWNIGKRYELYIPKENKNIQIPGVNKTNLIGSLFEIISLTSSDSAHGTYRWNNPATWPTEPVRNVLKEQ
jgi:filamentous hemagglutinin